MDKETQYILDLFKGRCVRCMKPAKHVHECVPRSQGKESLELDNRVALCLGCHNWAHSVGTKISAPILRKKRKQRLDQYYVNDTEIFDR